MTATMDDIDAAAEALGQPLDVDGLPCPEIANGFYTIAFPCGSHRTFRLFTQRRGKFAGKRLLGMLIGPDNTADYETFAFLESDGVKVWKRFANQKQAEYARLLWKMWGGEVIEGHELTTDKRCMKCNRTLTDPESQRLGIGPTCRGAE